MMKKITSLATAVCLLLWSVFALSQPTVGETIDDSTITASVKTTLIDKEEVHARNINVEVYKGSVALIGYVRNAEQHKMALELAKEVKGVTEVVDAILVVPEKRSMGVTLDDQTIETKVKVAVTEIGASHVFSVVTEVRNGEVLLGGFVDTTETRDAITKAVEDIKGVSKVHNRLAIKS